MMTDQQYTPTTDDILRCYMQRGGSEEEFNRWYEAEISATEQRVAVKALRDAADAVLEYDPRVSLRGIYAALRNRADRIANKEEGE